jgi:hypothetical protein
MEKERKKKTIQKSKRKAEGKQRKKRRKKALAVERGEKRKGEREVLILE